MNWNGFENYLQNKRLAPSTVKYHCKNLEYIERWCKDNRLKIELLNYNDLLNFIRYDQQRGCNNVWINKELCSLRHYYNHLIERGKSKVNPARDLYLKGNTKKVLQDILTPEQLENIYRKYAGKPSWSFREAKQQLIHNRNTVILGLLIFQGMQTKELKKLETGHINLTQGTIYIPGSRRSNNRILKLQAMQMIPLQEYLNRIRAELFNGIKDEGKLLNNCRNTVRWLMEILRKDGLVKSANQIRSSVIVNWLKQHNLRQVQYMAGHKHIGSTERYKQEDLEDLQRQLDLFHPLK